MMHRGSLRYLVLATMVAVVSMGSLGLAQKAPNLAGKWVFDMKMSEVKPTVPRIFNTTGAPAPSEEMEITQTAAGVTVKIGGVALLYRLDGTEGNISLEGRAGFPIGKATWQDGKLVATLTQEVFSPAKGDYMKVPLKEVYSVSGGNLILERTRTHIDGKTASEKLVYKKSSV